MANLKVQKTFESKYPPDGNPTGFTSISKWVQIGACVIGIYASVVVGLHYFISGDVRSLQTSLSDEIKRSDVQKSDYDKRLADQQEQIKAARSVIDNELIKLLDKAYGGDTKTGSQAKKVSMVNRLEATRDVVRVARETHTSLTPELLSRISLQLSQSQERNVDLPVYWQAASEIITYRSERSVGFQISLPPCTIANASVVRDQIPIPFSKQNGHLVLGIGPVLTRDIFTFHDCQVDLSQDEITPPKRTGADLWQVVYDHCVVRYAGGKIAAVGVTFSECLFFFNVDAKPQSLAMTTLTKQLLTSSNLGSLKIPERQVPHPSIPN